MAAASQSLDEGRPAPLPEARAVPANRYTGFKGQIQQVLGWKKGTKQQATAGESRSEQGTQSGLGKGVGSEQDTQSGLGKGVGSEQDTQSGLGKGVGSEQGTQSALGKGVGSEQGTQSALGKGVGSEQGTQSALGKGVGSEQGTQSALGKVVGSEQGTQSALGKGVGSEQGTQFVLGKGAGSEQGTRSVLGKGVGSEQDTQSVLGEMRLDQSNVPGNVTGLQQGTRSILFKTGLQQATQPVPVRGAGLEKGIQLSLGKTPRSEMSSQPVTTGDSKSEQKVQPMILNFDSEPIYQQGSDSRSKKTTPDLDWSNRSKQGSQFIMGEGAGFEQGTQFVMGEGAHSGCITQSALTKGTVSEQSSQFVLEQAVRSEKGTQPFGSCSSGSEQLIQFVAGDLKSEKYIQSVLGKGRGSEQRVQPVLGETRGSEQRVQPVLSEGRWSEQRVQPVLGEGRGSEQQVQLVMGLTLAPNPRTENVVDLKLESDEEARPVVGTESQSVQHIQSAVDRGTRSKQRIRPAVLQDVRSTQRMQSLLAWEERSEQCIHLPLGVNRINKQQKEPLKCQDVELEPWVQPALTENAGLERQIFISLTRNLSYISGLYDTVHLADGFGPLHDQHRSPDGAHLGDRCLKGDLPPRPAVRKRAKSCPGSPTERRMHSSSTRRNRVRFADALGLELTEVRSFDSAEEPTVPEHVFANLSNREPIGQLMWVQSFKKEFINPKEDVNFDERLNRQKVCLEAVTESELVISGTILVINLAYQKEVTVRYTSSDWKFFTDVPALFEISNENKTDRFTFTLNLSIHHVKPGSCIQFAIKYTVNGMEFWDNNDSKNYMMTYQSFQITVPNNNDNSLVIFN
ncbi:uncharacterized protein LOC144688687 [Cetorhinus maximus]